MHLFNPYAESPYQAQAPLDSERQRLLDQLHSLPTLSINDAIFFNHLKQKMSNQEDSPPHRPIKYPYLV